MGLGRTTAERNLGLVYLNKGLAGSAQATSYLDTAKRVFESIRFPGQADARRIGYLALLATTKGDTSYADQLVAQALSSPQVQERDVFLVAVAIARIRQGAFDQGLGLLERLKVTTPYWHLTAARDAESSGQLERAGGYYRRAIALAPANVESHRAFATFLELYRRDWASALAQHKIVADLEPTPENLLVLARRHRVVGNYNEAVRLINQVQLQFPDYREVSGVELARVALVRGDWDIALRTLVAVRQEFPDSAQVWELLAATYETLGRTEDAFDAARRSISLDPGWMWGHWRMAQLLLAHKRPSEAVTYLQRMLTLDSVRGDRMEVQALISLGDAYNQMTRPDLARGAFCQAQQLNRWGERAEYIAQQINALEGCSAK
jgi:Flp pilus assembly protein TadD